MADRGINVNEKKNGGLTALHLAAWNDRTEIVKELVDAKGINVNEKDNDGLTALHYAARYASANTVKALLVAKGINVNEQTKDGWNACDLAWKYNRPVSDELLREKEALYHKTEACLIQ